MRVRKGVRAMALSLVAVLLGPSLSGVDAAIDGVTPDASPALDLGLEPLPSFLPLFNVVRERLGVSPLLPDVSGPADFSGALEAYAAEIGAPLTPDDRESIASIENALTPLQQAAFAGLFNALAYREKVAEEVLAGIAAPEDLASEDQARLLSTQMLASVQTEFLLRALALEPPVRMGSTATSTSSSSSSGSAGLNSCGGILLDLSVNDSVRDCDYAFSFDYGGDDVYRNNAGGAAGGAPVCNNCDARWPGNAFAIDVFGDDVYEAVTRTVVTYPNGRAEAEGRSRDSGVCSTDGAGERPRILSDAQASGGAVLNFPNHGCWAEWDVQLSGEASGLFVGSRSEDASTSCVRWDAWVDGSFAGSTPTDCGPSYPIQRLEVGNGGRASAGKHVVRVVASVTPDWTNPSLDYVEFAGTTFASVIAESPSARKAHTGAGWWGVGGLIDVRGNDEYHAWLLDDVAATGSSNGHGGGMLLDLAGDDEYNVTLASGAANGAGVGFLADVSGNDVYRARGQANRVSLLNGAGFQSLWNLPTAGGILDIAGNDLYLDMTRTACSVYCGASNGARGFIIDLAGNDWYDANCRTNADRNGDYGLIYDAEGRDVYLDGRNGTQEIGCEAGVVDESVSPKPPQSGNEINGGGKQIDRTPTKNLATEGKWLVSPPFRMDQGVGQACAPALSWPQVQEACTQDPFALTRQGLRCLGDYTTDGQVGGGVSVPVTGWWLPACEPLPQALMTDGDEHSPSADAGQLYWLEEGKLFTLNPFTRVIEPLLLALNVTAFQAAGTSVVWRNASNVVLYEDTARNIRKLMGNATGELDFDGRHAVWDDNGCVRAFDVVLERNYGCVASGIKPRVSGDHVAFLNANPWDSIGTPFVQSLTLGVSRQLDGWGAQDVAIDGNLVAWSTTGYSPPGSRWKVLARDLADVWNRVFVLGEAPFLGGGIDVSGSFVVWGKLDSPNPLTYNSRARLVGRDVSHLRYTSPGDLGYVVEQYDREMRYATDQGVVAPQYVPLAGAEVVISQGLLAGSDAFHPRVSGNLVTWEECQLSRSGGYSPDSPPRCTTERDVYYAHLLGPEMVGVSTAGGIENCYSSASPESAPGWISNLDIGSPDLDEDGLGDCWAKYYAQVLQQLIDTVSDLDCDTLDNLGEFQWQTHPIYDQPPCFTIQGYPGVVLFKNGRDFDLDGLLDGYEARYIERANAYSSAMTYGSAGGASVAVQNWSYEARARNPAWSEYGSMVPQLCELPTPPTSYPCYSNSEWCFYNFVWESRYACEFVVTGETQMGGDLWYWPGPGGLGVRPPEDWYWEDLGLQYPGHPLSLASSGSSPLRYHLPGVALHHPLKDHDADGDSVRDMEDKNSDYAAGGAGSTRDVFTDGEEVLLYDTFPDKPDSDCDRDASVCHGSWQIAQPGSNFMVSLDRGTGDGLSDSREAYYALSESRLASIFFDEVASNNPLVPVRVDGIRNVLLDPDSDGDGVLDGDECLQSRFGILGHGPASNACDPNYEPFVNAPRFLNEAPCPSAYNADSDYDELGDGNESTLETNQCNPDTDGDLMPDGYEVAKGFSPRNPADGLLDPDQDGLQNWEEYCYPMLRAQCEQRTRDTKDKRMGVYWGGTDPLNPDVDNDLLCDGGGGSRCSPLVNLRGERDFATNATDPDHDNDGLPDGYEGWHGLNLHYNDANNDTDNDSHYRSDGFLLLRWSNINEYCYGAGLAGYSCPAANDEYVRQNGVYLLGTSPSNPNTDGDCGKDGWEVFVGSDPRVYTPDAQDADSDGLGFCGEAQAGTFPSIADSDNDGLCDGGRAPACTRSGVPGMPGEATYATGPLDADTDDDNWTDGPEAAFWDPGAAGVVGDSDGDGADNLHDADSDNDGIKDGDEKNGSTPTNPGSADEDGDGLTDPLEQNGWDITVNGALVHVTSDPKVKDTDADGLHDGEEFEKGSNPRIADTDGDGMLDAWEVKYGLAPASGADSSSDKDNDAMLNLWEYGHATDPTNPDTDGDGLPDGWENRYGLNATDPSNGVDEPTAADPDGDKLQNRKEYEYNLPAGWNIPQNGVWWNGTNPQNWDTDLVRRNTNRTHY